MEAGSDVADVRLEGLQAVLDGGEVLFVKGEEVALASFHCVTKTRAASDQGVVA